VDVLKRLADNKMRVAAVNLIRNHCCRLMHRAEDTYEHCDPLTVWNALQDKRLDYICAMGGGLGLDAALPGSGSGLAYSFLLEVSPGRTFKGKYCQLGSDQAGSMIRIGRRPDEEVFIYMCPAEVLDRDYLPQTPAGHCTGDTRLIRRHANVMKLFLAKCLSLLTCEGTVTCEDEYLVDVERADDWDFAVATNAL
jgi:hypothetical protein